MEHYNLIYVAILFLKGPNKSVSWIHDVHNRKIINDLLQDVRAIDFFKIENIFSIKKSDLFGNVE